MHNRMPKIRGIMSTYVEWNKLAEVVAVSVVAGAGVPSLFALGVRAVAGPGSHNVAGRRRPIRVLVAVASFAVVLAAVGLAIWIIAK